MPEVQASPEQTAGLFKFSWFSTFEAERTFPGKVLSLLDPITQWLELQIKKLCKKQRGVTYRCGYCSVKKMSTSTGKVFCLPIRYLLSPADDRPQDGLVRIQCECGGKHQDSKPRRSPPCLYIACGHGVQQSLTWASFGNFCIDLEMLTSIE